MMKTLTLAVALLALTTPGRAAEKLPPVAVYLAPPAGPFQDPQRIQSTRDLREKLGHATKDLRLVARPEDAILIVEVLDRTETRGEMVLPVKLTIGEYTTTLHGQTSGSSSWKLTALDAASQIKQFIRANAQKLQK